jgi:dihydroorotate dehydrogenase electron transfer subunit
MNRPMPSTDSSPSRTGAKSHRNTLFVENAVILSHESYAGNQYVLRVSAALCACHAQPGNFAHIQCTPALPLRRPLSIMRADAGQGWIELLYKDVGAGTHALSCSKVGNTINLIGPVGTPFRLDRSRRRVLMLGGGVGIPPMIFLADRLRADSHWRPLVLMGSEVPFPFSARPSRILVPGMTDGVIAAMPLLDDWGIPSRLASLQGYPGCHQGYITGLARTWLEALTEGERAEVSVYACGPHPMLEATARLASEFDLPCQVSLEEFMACAVGGCAGCTVRINTSEGPAMKRVCVDGPVFDASIIDW